MLIRVSVSHRKKEKAQCYLFSVINVFALFTFFLALAQSENRS